tara:strand:- start:419 stop:754 length:336 start_codon:yes stop_codon:yes gene_type:complete
MSLKLIKADKWWKHRKNLDIKFDWEGTPYHIYSVDLTYEYEYDRTVEEWEPIPDEEVTVTIVNEDTNAKFEIETEVQFVNSSLKLEYLIESIRDELKESFDLINKKTETSN